MPKIPHVYYDKASGSYYVVASLGFDEVTGKRMQKKKRGFKTQTEAKKWYDDFIAKHSKKAIVHGATLTVELFLEKYFVPHYKNKVTTRTFMTFSSKLKRLKYFYPMKMLDVKPIHIKKWHTDILEEGLSNNYLKDLHQTVKELFDMALTLGVVSENPARQVGNMKRTRKKVDFWTKEEFEKFIKTFEKDDVVEHLKYTCFLFLFMTGLRISELQALTWEDVDFVNKAVQVNKSMFYQNKNNWQINPTKTFASNRKIYLDDLTTKALSSWKKHQKHGEMAEVKSIRIHDLRHSHASLLLSLGMNDLELKNRLGHADIQTTLGVYSHLRPSAMKEVADKLEGVISL